MKIIRKNSREILIYLLFLFLPFFDSLNGFLVRTQNYYGVGSFYHLLLIVMLSCLAYASAKFKYGYYEKYLIIMILVICISVMINSISGTQIQSITIERLEKLICTVLSIACLNRLMNKNILSKKEFKRIVDLQLLLVPLITLIANFMGVGNYTYQAAKVGKIGFYTGSNEPVIVFGMLACITLSILIRDFSIKYLILFFSDILCLIYVQSKMGYLMTALIGLAAVLCLLGNFLKKKRVKPMYLLGSIPIIVGGIVVGRNTFSKTIGDFLSRQAYQSQYLSSEGTLAFLSSGRILRFESLLGPITDGNPLYVLFKIFFGQGAGFGYSELFEMDYMDAFLYGGIFLLSVLVLLSIRIVKNAKKNCNEKLSVFAILLVLAYAFVAGHLWTGGVSGLYFALFVGYFTQISPDYYKKET